MRSCANAVDTLERARDRRPDMLEIRSELAQQYFDCRLQHLYAQVVDGILTDFPPDLQLYYTLAVIFRNVGQYDNLVKVIGELRKLNPDFPIQRIFSSLEPCQRAIRVLEQVRQRMPNEPQLYLSLSVQYGICEDPKSTIRILNEAARKFPKEKAFPLLLRRINGKDGMPPGMSAYDLAAPGK
jgi:hypothetical protein